MQLYRLMNEDEEEKEDEAERVLRVGLTALFRPLTNYTGTYSWWSCNARAEDFTVIQGTSGTAVDMIIIFMEPLEKKG